MLATWTDMKMPEDHEKKYGRFNDFPPNFKEITEAEFAGSWFMVYSPKFVEWRKISDKDKKFFKYQMSIRLFYYHDNTGLGIVCDNGSSKVRFFSFALCGHDYETKNVGRCLNTYTCKKCGYAETIDSSD